MSSIRRRDTKPERLVRSGLWRAGLRYRKDVNGLPGRPDLALRKFRTVVFVNGCFWHAHQGCRHFKAPSSRPDFWEAKFTANRDRDSAATGKLIDTGWRVVRIWECAVRCDLLTTLDLARDAIKGGDVGVFDIHEDPSTRQVRMSHDPALKPVNY